MPVLPASERLDLRLNGVEVTAQGGRVLLRTPALALPAGQALAIRGASGAGKSTLLMVLAGLIRPQTGSVAWGATDLARLTEAGRARFRRRQLGLIFQDLHLFEELTALDNAAVAAGFAPKAERTGLRASAALWLERLGLGDADGRRLDKLSGGERQRIAVARALAGNPPIILADEPTAALDRASAVRLGEDLVRLSCEGGRTLVVVTHDPDLAARLDRVLTLADGEIVDDVVL